MADKDPHYSFEDSGVGIGQMADGSIDIYPLADAPKRARERDSQDAATAYAMQQSERGFPEEPADPEIHPDDPRYPAYLAKVAEMEEAAIPEVETPESE